MTCSNVSEVTGLPRCASNPRAQRLDKVIPAHARHGDFREDEIKLVIPIAGERLFRAGLDRDPGTFALEQRAKRLETFHRIVDQQDLQSPEDASVGNMCGR
jgi:hypothetical protein